MNNLVDNLVFDFLKRDMDQILAKKLKDRKDNFLKADQYMTLWNYLYDRTDSVKDVINWKPIGKAFNLENIIAMYFCHTHRTKQRQIYSAKGFAY